MKQSQQRPLWLASLSLAFIGAAFAACTSLDSRHVTRGPDEAVGGDKGLGGEASGAGASENVGGQVDDNPFGGDTFTGGAPPVVDGPPEVVNVDPADAANDAQPATDVALLFSEGLAEATVTTDNIKVMDGVDEVQGSLSYSGVVSTFNPTRRLSLLASYDVSVSTGVTDIGGQALKAPFASKFTVRDGVWTDQNAVFDDQAAWGREQDVAIDAEGNTLTVWSTIDPTTNAGTGCVARWYRVSTGWKEPVKLTEPGEACSAVRAAVSPEGDAVVAWFSGAYPNYLTRARRFSGGEWEASAQNVAQANATDPNGGNYDLSVACAGGQVLVAWIANNYDAASETTIYGLQLSATTPSGAWPTNSTSNFSAYSNATIYESLSGVSAALDNNGNALVAFYYYTPTMGTDTGQGVYYARKAANGPWQYPSKIPSTSNVNYGPVLASDGDGAMVVWSAVDTANKYHLMGSRYTKTKQFVAPVELGDPDLTEYQSLNLRHSLASDGKAFFATWTQSVGSSSNTYVNRFDIAAGKWDALPATVSDGVANAGISTVGVDAHGNALVSFAQEATTTILMAARYTASDGKWGVAEPITEDGKWFRDPMLAVAANGVSTLFFRAGRPQRFGETEVLGGQYRVFK